MSQRIFLAHLTALRKQIDLFVSSHFSVEEQRRYFLQYELEQLKTRQFFEAEKELAQQELDEMETQVFENALLQQCPSLMEQIREISSKIDQNPEDPDLWLQRALLWKEKEDWVAMASDLLRGKHLSSSNSKIQTELSWLLSSGLEPI